MIYYLEGRKGEQFWSLLLGLSNKPKDSTQGMLRLPSDNPSYIPEDQEMTTICIYEGGDPLHTRLEQDSTASMASVISALTRVAVPQGVSRYQCHLRLCLIALWALPVPQDMVTWANGCRSLWGST